MSLLYKAVRVGQYGRPFIMYKLKTMRDIPGPSSTSDDDPRITRIGKFFRKTKLDEVPQLINILRGEMTLIGWRPEVQQYLQTIPDEVLKTKPGIIGWATLSNLDEGSILKGHEDPELAYEQLILPEKRQRELYYARHRSFWFDIRILTQTLWQMIIRS